MLLLNGAGEKKARDSHRPHRFEFFIDGSRSEEHVKMRYFHWCHQREAWNKEDIFVFNHVPDLADLKPAPLRQKFLAKLKACCVGINTLSTHLADLALVTGACAPAQNCPKCACMAAFQGDARCMVAPQVAWWADQCVLGSYMGRLTSCLGSNDSTTSPRRMAMQACQ